VNRILVVDDDAVTLEALPSLLRSRLPDTVVDTAGDAKNALALVRTWSYQIVFIDVRMPSVDGLTLLRQLGGYTQGARVIVMTANVDGSLEMEMSQAGVYAFLPKPAFPDLIIAKVQAALRRMPS
jgi:CheY-like chemotaxis protein